MSITRRIAFGAAASWFSRGVTIVLGLVLMPVLFRHLPKEELGVWLLLGQSWATMGILDLGFGATLTRRIALAKGKSGSDPGAPLTDETLRDIADLVAAGRRVYRFMAVGVFIVSWSLGFVYLRNIELHNLSLPTVWIAWTILCACQAITVWATVWTCLLQGVGYIGWDALISSFISAAMLIAQILAVLAGGGLVALATIAAVAVLLQRAMTRWFARRRRPELFSLQGHWNPALLRSIAPVAFRAWLTALGIVLAMQTDQFFIASFKGAGEIPAYRAAYVVLINLNTLGVTFAGASGVFISHLWQARQFAQIHRIVQRNLRLGLGLVACGGITLVALGADFFDVWLGRGNFIGYPILLTFFAMQFLEVQAYIISNSSRATEDEAFAFWSIAGGCLKIVLSFLLAARWGLLGIALASFLSLLLTNHWFMAWRGLHRLDFGLNRHLTRVLSWVGLLALVTLGSVAGVKWLLAAQTPLVRVIVCVAVSGCLLALYLWLLVLDASERARVSGWYNRRFKAQAV